MTLQSLGFLVFAALVWLLAAPVRSPRLRQVLLLVASYAFYAMWGMGFLGLLVVSTAFNYVCGEWVRRSPNGRRLSLGIAGNVLFLGVFRYLPPLLNTVKGPGTLSIAIPVGISFWTFQAISYLFDLYRGEEIDPSLREFALYMAFWPTVLSGPVCRVPEMLPQFRSVTRSTWDDVSNGVTRILIGLFMKVVLAQLVGTGFNPGEGVSYGFDSVSRGLSGPDVWLLAIGFGFQLFFDFAGYSNIVIGVARLFGIKLRENFDRPFLSRTPSEFWTRWHMSLSFWIRDYVFLPLATARRDRWWRNASLVIAMGTFGLWHGATVLFIAWGLYHGLLLVGHREFERVQKRRGWRLTGPVAKVVSWGLTFLLISLGWILFRAGSVGQALSMLSALVHPGTYRSFTLRPNFYIVVTAIALGYFAFMGVGAALSRWKEQPAVVQARWLAAPVGFAIIILAVIVWSKNQSLFIYFQF
jgi:alginate O-acetyltransferase complex protein AlgI